MISVLFCRKNVTIHDFALIESNSSNYSVAEFVEKVPKEGENEYVKKWQISLNNLIIKCFKIFSIEKISKNETT